MVCPSTPAGSQTFEVSNDKLWCMRWQPWQPYIHSRTLCFDQQPKPCSRNGAPLLAHHCSPCCSQWAFKAQKFSSALCWLLRGQLSCPSRAPTADQLGIKGLCSTQCGGTFACVDTYNRARGCPPLLTSWALVPAARTSRPPEPGCSSMLCTEVPVGMACRGRLLPGRMGTSSPDLTTSPGDRLWGARM